MGEPEESDNAFAHLVAGPVLLRGGQWALGHVAWLTGGLLVLAVLVKVVAVARLDLATAVALATAGAPTAVLLSTLTLLMPWLISLLLIATFWYAVRLVRGIPQTVPEGRHEELAVAISYARLILVGLSSAPLVYLVAAFVPLVVLGAVFSTTALVVLTAVLARRTADRFLAEERVDWIITRHLRAGAVVLFVLLVGGGAFTSRVVVDGLFSDRVWLPAEAVSRPGEAPWTAYPVQREGGTVLYLRDSDRTLVRIPAEVAATAWPCEPSGYRSASLLQHWRGERGPSTPRCPRR